MGDKDKKSKKDKKDKKEKKEKAPESDAEEEKETLKSDYIQRLFVSPIADPLASDKLCKKLLKLI